MINSMISFLSAIGGAVIGGGLIILSDNIRYNREKKDRFKIKQEEALFELIKLTKVITDEIVKFPDGFIEGSELKDYFTNVEDKKISILVRLYFKDADNELIKYENNIKYFFKNFLEARNEFINNSFNPEYINKLGVLSSEVDKDLQSLILKCSDLLK